jgi:hypothetical protein
MPLEDVRLRNLEHKVNKSGWLRAAVLGINDGLVSTAAIMIGVSAAAKNDFLVTAGIAGIVAGAMSMAVGEYVSVSSQTDIEDADRELEMKHLAIDHLTWLGKWRKSYMNMMHLKHIYGMNLVNLNIQKQDRCRQLLLR